MSKEILISGWIFESTQTFAVNENLSTIGIFQSSWVYMHIWRPQGTFNIYRCIRVHVFLPLACLRLESPWKMQPSQSILTTKPSFLSVQHSLPEHQSQNRGLARALRAHLPHIPLHRTQISPAQKYLFLVAEPRCVMITWVQVVAHR